MCHGTRTVWTVWYIFFGGRIKTVSVVDTISSLPRTTLFHAVCAIALYSPSSVSKTHEWEEDTMDVKLWMKAFVLSLTVSEIHYPFLIIIDTIYIGEDSEISDHSFTSTPQISQSILYYWRRTNFEWIV